MTELAATPPLTRDLTIGGARLRAHPPRHITAIAPFDLAAAESAGFPRPGEMADGSLIWAGRALAFVFDAPVPAPLAALSALSDQSDGWAGFDLTGPDAADILARLLPIDCAALVGSARSTLGHHPLLIWCSGPEAFTLLTYRSMAASAAHDLETAMQALAARRNLPPDLFILP